MGVNGDGVNGDGTAGPRPRSTSVAEMALEPQRRGSGLSRVDTGMVVVVAVAAAAVALWALSALAGVLAFLVKLIVVIAVVGAVVRFVARRRRPQG